MKYNALRTNPSCRHTTPYITLYNVFIIQRQYSTPQMAISRNSTVQFLQNIRGSVGLVARQLPEQRELLHAALGRLHVVQGAQVHEERLVQRLHGVQLNRRFQHGYRLLQVAPVQEAHAHVVQNLWRVKKRKNNVIFVFVTQKYFCSTTFIKRDFNLS